MNIPDFILELVRNGIRVELHKDGFEVFGFYKSSSVIIRPQEQWGTDSFEATARYDEKTAIYELADVVSLHYQWWQNSKDRFDGWKQPDTDWIPLLEQFGKITKKVIPAVPASFTYV